jgi:hypothetical protein
VPSGKPVHVGPHSDTLYLAFHVNGHSLHEPGLNQYKIPQQESNNIDSIPAMMKML